MKRTFITRLPNKAGAFLKATRIVAQSGANITRVSYNKAVDLHVLFLEVSGSQAQLDTIAVRLNDVGYILNEDNPGRTILLEFHLPNVPSAVLPVLELIDSFNRLSYLMSFVNNFFYKFFNLFFVAFLETLCLVFVTGNLFIIS